MKDTSKVKNNGIIACKSEQKQFFLKLEIMRKVMLSSASYMKSIPRQEIYSIESI